MNANKKNWVLSLLIDTSKNEIHENNRNNFNFLSWSQYDRVNIIEVDTFKDLCTKSASKKLSGERWTGTERNLHLVPDEEIFGRDFTWNLLKYSDSPLIRVDNKSTKDYGLYTVLTLRYDDNLSSYKNHVSFKQLSNLIREHIYKFLSEFISANYADALTYYPFYSLDSEDLVLIFLSDELESVYQCIEYVKTITYVDFQGKEKYVFSSLSVFPGLNIVDFKLDPKIDAIVKVCLYPNVNTTEFLKQVKEYFINNNIHYVDKIYLRNSCMYFELVSNENIFLLYRDDGLLNGVAEFYKDNIKSSRTYWVKRNGLTDIYNFGLKFPDSQISSIKWADYHLTDVNDSYDSNIIVKNKVAHFILSEYDRLINTPRCKAWLPILAEQRTIINRYVKILEGNNDNDTMCSFLNYCQTSLTYINQACSPIYEIPYHNYYYHGSFNDILKMYYGIISSILQIGKSFHHESKQHSSITFAVNFEAATKIHSRYYTFDNQQFVFFHIPYENFYDYSLTIPALIHEVFHYILPYSNKNRNEALLSLITKKIMNEIKCQVFKKGFGNDNNRYIVDKYWDKKFDLLNEIIIKYVEQRVPNYAELTTSQLKNSFFSDEMSFRAVYKGIIGFVYNFLSEDISNKASKDEYLRLLSESCDLEAKDLLSDDFYKQIIRNDFFDFIDDVLLGTKEAFCDIFILKILNIDFMDYIKLLFNILICSANLSDLEDYLMNCNFYSSIMEFGTISIRVSILADYCYRQEMVGNDKEKTTIVSWFINKVNKVTVTENKKVFTLFQDFLIDKFKYYQENFGEYNAHINLMALEGISQWNIKGNSELFQIMNNLTEFYNSSDDTINIDLMTNFIYFYENSAFESMVTEQVRKPEICTRNLNVQSLEEYIKAVRKILIYHGSKNKLWFRGVCSNTYYLTPSLFRHINHNLSLYTNQANILKTAYERTLSYNEIWDKSIVGQMALLQHYGVPTNLLDFSLDMLVALHFALNPDDEEDKKKIKCGEYTPSVYIFDPVVYSEAVSELTGKKNINDFSTDVSPIVYDIDGSTDMNRFFIGQMDYECLIDCTKKVMQKKIKVKLDRLNYKCPIPIIVRQSNDRIHNQNGVFLAYSLVANPSSNEHQYDYLALNILQDFCDEFFDENNVERKTFLYSIDIDSSSVDSIRRDLRTLNVSEGKYYPDISNILKEAVEEHDEKIGIKNSI